MVLHFVILCGRNKVGFVIDFKRAAANPMQKPFVTLQGNLVTHLLLNLVFLLTNILHRIQLPIPKKTRILLTNQIGYDEKNTIIKKPPRLANLFFVKKFRNWLLDPVSKIHLTKTYFVKFDCKKKSGILFLEEL